MAAFVFSELHKVGLTHRLGWGERSEARYFLACRQTRKFMKNRSG
jgi:hypothetical protein